MAQPLPWHQRRLAVAHYREKLALLNDWQLGRLHDAVLARACECPDASKRRELIHRAEIIERTYYARQPAAASS